jgi:hypothetical protein
MSEESTLRRPDFLGGTPIVLADGQAWIFPGPPGQSPSTQDDADGVVAALFALPTYEFLIAALDEADSEAESLRAELSLAIFLLRAYPSRRV